jgi:hypothetical protein
VLAAANANIVDVSQTTLREFFAMIMMVDLEKATSQRVCTVDAVGRWHLRQPLRRNHVAPDHDHELAPPPRQVRITHDARACEPEGIRALQRRPLRI